MSDELKTGRETGATTAADPANGRPPRKNSQVPSATGIRRAAMDWLARREYSRTDLEQKLVRRFPDATAAIGPVLDQLEHEGLLSDTRYLESITNSHVRRGYGPLRIRAALRAKGLGNRPVDDTVEEDPTAGPVTPPVEIDWLVQVRAVRNRKFGEALPATPAERNRQMAFLMRRGFSSDLCRKACLPPRDE